MMPSATRRRRTVQEESDSEEELPQTQRRRRGPPSDDSEGEEEEENGDGDGDMDMDATHEGTEQLLKKFVRYALACEYQRIPIRRAAVAEKVFLKRRENFKQIFDLAQKELRSKFGMALVELPVREKTSMKEKRDAQKKKSNSKPTASYILTTILPTEYRVPSIMPPSIIESSKEEAQYVALCTTIVAMIALSQGGSLPNAKLETYLSRLNIDKNMPMDSTSNILKKMQNQQYIFKVVDKTTDDENIDWIVGPRGHAEIGKMGIQRFVREIYGDAAPEDLPQRLQRSLGVEVARPDGGEDEDEEPDNGDPGPSTQRRLGRQ